MDYYGSGYGAGYGRNPYGAVPEALKETRLTLRDVMTDYLKNKALEAELKLGLVKADVDKARVDAEIARNEMLDRRAMAQMSEQQRQYDVGAEQTARRIAEEEARGAFERGPKFDFEKEMQRKNLAVQQGHLGLAARKWKYETEELPLGSMASSIGLPAGMLTALGYDPNARMTRSRADKLLERHGPIIPHLQSFSALQKFREAQRGYEEAARQGDTATQARLLRDMETAARAFQVAAAMTKALSPEKAAEVQVKLIKDGMDPEEARQAVDQYSDFTSKSDRLGQRLRENPNYYEHIVRKNQYDPFFDDKVQAAVSARTAGMKSPKEQAALATAVKELVDKNDFAAVYKKLGIAPPEQRRSAPVSAPAAPARLSAAAESPLAWPGASVENEEGVDLTGTKHRGLTPAEWEDRRADAYNYFR